MRIAFAIVVFVVEGVGFVDAGHDGEDGGSGEFGVVDTVVVALAGVGDGSNYVAIWVVLVVFNILNFDPCTRSRACCLSWNPRR